MELWLICGGRAGKKNRSDLSGGRNAELLILELLQEGAGRTDMNQSIVVRLTNKTY